MHSRCQKPTTSLSGSSVRRSWVFIALIMMLGLSTGTALADCVNPKNAIEAENCLAGTPQATWDVAGVGDTTTQGFATNISVNVGQTVSFKIKSSASAYTIDIYRMGFYAGNGARKITTINPSASLPQSQPACLNDAATGMVDCGNWGVSASWAVPSTAVSGIYFGHINANNGDESLIFFIVRNDASHSDLLFQTSDTSWQAYNNYGGRSLYGDTSFNLGNRAKKVSYNRPFWTRSFESASWVMTSEYPMVRFLEANGYDVTYFTGVDSARSGALILNHKVFVSTGHDEYWSGPARTNVEAARDAGVNLAFFSGNEVFWKTRWENSIDGSSTPYRTLVCYKETLDSAKTDPQDPPTWTGTWRDKRFSPPADGGRPENGLTGTIFFVNGPGPDNNGLSIKVPAADGKMRFWRNTNIATQTAGSTVTLPAATLGYEWDATADNGAQPAGLFFMSTATYSLTTDYLLDEGATYGAGTATHHLTMYRAPSGALVFGAGTVQWAWGLDNHHDADMFAAPNPDVRMQQATVNLLADMGAQPATLIAGLVAATKSTDVTPPTSTITSPANNTTVANNATVNMSGTASDVGGVVGGVEISIDNKVTWHPANGRGSWTYSFTAPANTTLTIFSRAVDDSGNIEIPTSSITMTVGTGSGGGGGGSPTCTGCIWPSGPTPATTDPDTNSVEVGVKFRSDVAGNVTAVRFYRASTNAGPHAGHLWTSTGTLLGSVTFSGESASGWQQQNFTTPIPISANTTYVVSYFAPSGHYSTNSGYFTSAGVDTPPLHALSSAAAGGNGVYSYGASSVFPSSTFSDENYWVDLVFVPNGSTFTISGALGTAGAGATVALSGTATATATADASGNYSFTSLANGSYTVTPTKAGVSFAPTSQSVTINGANATANFTATLLTFTISGTVSGAGASGATMTLTGGSGGTTTTDASGNYSFTGVVNGSYSLSASKVGFSYTPTSQNVTINGANVTGVNFSSTVQGLNISGTITGAGANGSIVTLSGSSSTTTTSDASGNYTFTGLANGTFTVTPGKSGIIFTPASQNVTLNGASQTGVNFSSAAQTFVVSGTVTGATISGVTISVTGSATATATTDASGNYSFNLANGSYTITPSKSGFTFTPVSRAVTVNGAAVTAQNFVSAAVVGGSTFTIWNSAAVPSVAADPDTGAVELGVRFSSDVNGAITGIRFYKGSTNTGTHTGSLWSNTGTLLATATFAGETTSGWQQVLFSTPVNIAANTIYVASYHTTVGHYSVDQNYFTTAGVDNVPLHAPADGVSGANGVYVYGTGGVFPANTFQGSNYWVDVVLSTGPQTYNISGTISGPGGNGATVTLGGASTGSTTADASGNYTFTGLAGSSSYTVTPGKSGYVYSPISQNVTIGSANATGVNFTSVAQTFSLSGTISGNGGNGATVTLSGTASATATADTSGNYSFAGLANGSYTVTPTKSGFVFTPVSQNATVSGANVTAVNFTSAQTFSISGTVSGSGGIGTTLTLSGASSATTTADASGNYTFSGLLDGASYTVTPSKTGLTFTPVNQAVTISGANATGVNFTAVGNTFNISGTISGAGGGGATVTLSGLSAATTTADASGNYTFTGLVNGGYTVTPSKSGFVFTPASQNVTLSGANQTGVNFTSAAQTYTISGTISGAGGNAATVSLTGAATSTTTADASGNYSFTGLANGSYTVTPSKAGYNFTPAAQNVTVSGANQTANFSSALQTFSLGGTISGTGGNAATVTLTGTSTATVTANASGVYSFTGLANGSYTVTPSKAGFTFTPASQNVTISGANVSAVNFTSTGTGSTGLAVDITTFTDRSTNANTIVSPAFTTHATNELLLAFIATDGAQNSATTVTGVTGSGLTWTLVRRTNTQSGTSEIWRAFAPAVITNGTVTGALSRSTSASITVVSFTGADPSGTGGAGAIGAIGGANGIAAPSASVVTTRANSWVFAVGNDWDRAVARTVGPNQTIIHQYLATVGDTYWVQRQNATTQPVGTTVTINDTAPTNDRFNLSVVEILPAP